MLRLRERREPFRYCVSRWKSVLPVSPNGPSKTNQCQTGQRLTRWGQITSARMPEAEYGTRYLAGAINIWQPMRKELRQLRTAKQWSQRSGAK